VQTGWVILASLLYAVALFAVAWFGDRHASLTQRQGIRPLIYSLALAVYCSSWTFYGAVGTAARQGLGLGLSIFQRIARLLDHPLTVRSRPGRDSAFGIPVPWETPPAAVPCADQTPKTRHITGIFDIALAGPTGPDRRTS